MILNAVGHRMRHVIGQDQKTLNQRGRQHSDDGQRNISDQIPKPPPDHCQAKKRNNSRQSCGKNRQRHPAGGILGGLDRALTTAGAPISMFADHNRIIDNNPQRDNQRKQRHHIDRDTRHIHQRNRSHHRGWDTGCDPKRSAGVQKQKQQPHHQRQTG